MEIGSRGHIDKPNQSRLKSILRTCSCENVKPRDFIRQLSKISLVASFVIFYSRHDQVWDGVTIYRIVVYHSNVRMWRGGGAKESCYFFGGKAQNHFFFGR